MLDPDGIDRDKPHHPRTDRAARRHSCMSPTQAKSMKKIWGPNRNRTPLRQKTFWTKSSRSRKTNFWKALRQDDSDGADSEVRSAAEAAFFAGWRAKKKTEGNKKARGFQEPVLLDMTTLENATAHVLLGGQLVTGMGASCVER